MPGIMDCFTVLRPRKEVTQRLRAISRFDLYSARCEVVHSYSFGVPCEETVTAAAAKSPLVEVGAGSGHWAKLIAAAGGDIIATDAGDQGQYSKFWPTAGIERLDAAEAVRKYADRNVFMCWPCYNKDWAYRAAAAMEPGRYLVYIGESAGGCTADITFFELLDASFDEVDRIAMPTWECIHDTFRLFVKRECAEVRPS
jgi:hypothetical protein